MPVKLCMFITSNNITFHRQKIWINFFFFLENTDKKLVNTVQTILEKYVYST